MKGQILALILSLAATACGAPGSPGGSSVERDVDRLLSPLVENDLVSGSVLLARNGEILLAKGYGLANREHGIANSPETVFGIASVTKSITAIAVLQLVERGQLRLEDPVARFLPDFPAGDRITVGHLLTHTSGIRSYVFLPGFAQKQRLELDVRDVVDWIAESELEFEPGDRFRYGNSGFMLLTMIIEEVSGLPYERYLRENVFDPAGMEDSGLETFTRVVPHRAAAHSRDGCTGEITRAAFREPTFDRGGGSLYSTVMDFHRLDRALRTDRILSAGTRALMETPQVETPWGDSYAHGWFVGQSHGRRLVHHEGGSAGVMTSFRRFVDDDVLVVALFNQDLMIADELFSRLDAIALGEPWDPPFATGAGGETFEGLASFTGTYAMDPEGTLFFGREGERLFIEEPGCVRFEVWPMSPTRGFATGANALLAFSGDETTGRVRLRAQYGILRWEGERTDEPD